MKAILEIDEKYAGVLSVTAIGTSYLQTYVTTTAVDLSNHNHLTIGADGKWIHSWEEEDGDSTDD